MKPKKSYENVPHANRDAYTVVLIANPCIQTSDRTYAKLRNLTREKRSNIASDVHCQVANTIAKSGDQYSSAIVAHI